MKPSSLYLVRHGQAVSAGAPGAATDRERYLSDEGKGVLKLEARALKSLGVAPAAILCSPYARAQETAQILRQEMGISGAIEESDLLEPGGNPILITQLIRSRTVDPIVVVGHAPSIEELCVFLCSGRERGAAFVRLKAGGVAFISFPERLDAGLGIIEWLLTPEQLIKCAAHAGGKG